MLINFWNKSFRFAFWCCTQSSQHFKMLIDFLKPLKLQILDTVWSQQQAVCFFGFFVLSFFVCCLFILDTVNKSRTAGVVEVGTITSDLPRNQQFFLCRRTFSSILRGQTASRPKPWTSLASLVIAMPRWAQTTTVLMANTGILFSSK